MKFIYNEKIYGMPKIHGSTYIKLKSKWIFCAGIIFITIMVMVALPQRTKNEDAVEDFGFADDNVAQRFTIANERSVIAAKAEIDARKKDSASSMNFKAQSYSTAEKRRRLEAPLILISNQKNGQQGNDSNLVNKERIKNNKAQLIDNLGSYISAGTLIDATLETAINTDLPGSVRAIISRNVYADNGERILIPQGSKVIGAYKRAFSTGQQRVFVIWQRIITAAGVSIAISEAGVSPLGVAGIAADSINRHFWQRFGEASLLAIIAGGAATIAQDNTSGYTAEEVYREEISSGLRQAARQSLQENLPQKPTFKVNPGHRVKIFVAKDIDFAGVLQQE